ncbi:MAG: aldo/keto reductase [Paenibacillus sp.]|nr:aldo/keto reductase [Paenibacillus sp.]
MNRNIPTCEVDGIKLSRLMLGTAQLGISGYGIANRTGEADAKSLLDRCADLGINCFDTALEYGDAELKLGAYFAGKQAPFIVSKLKTDLTLDAAAFEKQVYERTETILQRLRLSKLPVLMIHDPSVLEAYGGLVAAVLGRMRSDGLIERAGVSLGANSDEQFASVGSLLRNDVYEMIQLPLHLWDRRAINCGALPQFRQDHKIVVARSVFLQGLFFGTGEQLPSSLRPRAAVELASLRRIAEAEAMSVEQLAVAYVRDTKGVHLLVIGAERADQIDHNAALIGCQPLSERASHEIETLFGQLPLGLITPGLWPQLP